MEEKLKKLLDSTLKHGWSYTYESGIFTLRYLDVYEKSFRIVLTGTFQRDVKEMYRKVYEAWKSFDCEQFADGWHAGDVKLINGSYIVEEACERRRRGDEIETMLFTLVNALYTDEEPYNFS